MSTKRMRAVDAPLPEGADNFKLIAGIGPAVEGRLHAAGILTYAQLAAAAPGEILAPLADLSGFSLDRIEQQDWIGRAAALAAAEPERPIQSAGQPYATFTVQLLFSDSDTVRRTRLAHVQSGWEESWAGWDAGHLVRTIAAQAGIETDVPPAHEAAAASPQSAPPTIRAVAARLRAEEGEASFLAAGAPYTIVIDLETASPRPAARPVEVDITATAHELGSGQRVTIGALHTPAGATQQTVTLGGRPLGPGIYRIEVHVAAEPRASGAEAPFRGELVCVL